MSQFSYWPIFYFCFFPPYFFSISISNNQKQNKNKSQPTLLQHIIRIYISVIFGFQSDNITQIPDIQELYFQDIPFFFLAPYFILMNSVILTYSVPHTYIKCINLQIIKQWIFSLHKKANCLSLRPHLKTYLNKLNFYFFQVTLHCIKTLLFHPWTLLKDIIHTLWWRSWQIRSAFSRLSCPLQWQIIGPGVRPCHQKRDKYQTHNFSCKFDLDTKTESIKKCWVLERLVSMGTWWFTHYLKQQSSIERTGILRNES